MTIPTINPITTAHDICHQFSICNNHIIANVATTIKAELKLVPNDNDFNKSFILAFSLVLTANMPIIDKNIPMAAINIGAITALYCISIFPEEI